MESSKLLELIGATMLASLWQGVFVFGVAILGLLVMQKQSAKARHNWLLICLLVLPLGLLYSAHSHYLELSTVSQTFTKNTISSDLSEFTNSQLPTTQSTPPKNETFSLSQFNLNAWFGIAWVFGLALFLLKTSASFFQVKRLKTNMLNCSDSRVNTALEQIKADLRLKSKIIVRTSAHITSPLVTGIFKPIILFPIGLAQGLSTAEIEMILLHELAHLQRRDLLIHMVINGLKSVFFFHPVFWWLESQIDNEREFATDEWALKQQPNSLTLASALAKTQEHKMLGMQLALAGRSKSQLLKRIYKIMDKKQQFNWSGTLVTVLALSAILALTSMQTKKEDNSTVVQYKSKGRIVYLGDKTPKKIEGDSLDIYKGLVVAYQSDSIKLNQAVLDIIQNDSPIEIKLNAEGGIDEILKNGKPLSGAEFKIYKQAYEQLNEYTNSRIKKSNAEWLEAKEEKMKAQAEFEKIKDLELQELLEEQQNLSEEQLEQKLKLELMKQELQLKRELVIASAQQKAALEQQEQQVLIETLSQSIDSMSLEELQNIEERSQKLLQHITQVKQVHMEEFEKRLNEVREQLEVVEETANIMEAEAISQDLRTYSFIKPHESKATIVRYALENAKFGSKDQLIDLDGKITNVEEFDLNKLDLTTVEKIEYFANDEMRKEYPKRKVKGKTSIIRITTN